MDHHANRSRTDEGVWAALFDDTTTTIAQLLQHEYVRVRVQTARQGRRWIVGTLFFGIALVFVSATVVMGACMVAWTLERWWGLAWALVATMILSTLSSVILVALARQRWMGMLPAAGNSVLDRKSASPQLANGALPSRDELGTDRKYGAGVQMPIDRMRPTESARNHNDVQASVVRDAAARLRQSTPIERELEPRRVLAQLMHEHATQLTAIAFVAGAICGSLPGFRTR